MEEFLFSHHHQHASPGLSLLFLSLLFSLFPVFRSVFSTFNFCLLFVLVPVLEPAANDSTHSSSLFFYCFRCRSGDYLALLFLSGPSPHPPSLPDCIALLWSRTLAHMKFPSASALDWRDSRCTYRLAQLDLATEIESLCLLYDRYHYFSLSLYHITSISRKST